MAKLLGLLTGVLLIVSVTVTWFYISKEQPAETAPQIINKVAGNSNGNGIPPSTPLYQIQNVPKSVQSVPDQMLTPEKDGRVDDQASGIGSNLPQEPDEEKPEIQPEDSIQEEQKNAPSDLPVDVAVNPDSDLIPQHVSLEAFWSPFSSKLSAQGFLDRVKQLTELNLEIIEKSSGKYLVAFPYTNEQERQEKISLIEEKTHLKLFIKKNDG